MASFTANDVLLDIEKLETMLTNNSNSSDSMSLHFSPVESRLTTMNMRFTGSSKVYLRNLNKLLSDIETKQKVLTTNSSSMLKRLQPTTSNARSLTFSSLFTRPTVKVSLNHRQEPKNISFGQLISSKLNLPTIYANHQSQYGCAKLNEKMWIVHSREQLIKAVEEESQSQSSHIDDENNFDWNRISEYYLGGKWSGDVCKNAWKQVCNPKINQSKWTNKEERRLISIVEREPLTADRWTSIAQELGTDRSAYLCAKRYMQIINEKYSKRPLTDDERKQIISSIHDDNQGFYTKYNKLAYQLGDRTREFIYNQWVHIDPSCKRGRWSNEEQAQLLSRIENYDKKITNWSLVSSIVQTRSSRQCRERALDSIKNGNRTKKDKHRLFTADEDRLLLELHGIHGGKWSIIAKEFSSRTDNSLLVRHRMLLKAQSQWLWFCQVSERMKNFLYFLYEKSNGDSVGQDSSSNNQIDQQIQQDLEQCGFYRRGLPLTMTDDEFNWFQQNPSLIDRIAQIVLDEFQDKRICCRKFKAEIKDWFTAATTPMISDDQIRQMLSRTIPSRKKRKSTNKNLTTNKKAKIDSVDCKEEPQLPNLPSILSTTSRHILRPMANQFFTSQSTSKLSVNPNSTHFCPYLILIRQSS